ncbi:MAG: SDR family oxidoreductase, partial [Planctomycetota bacterium]
TGEKILAEVMATNFTGAFSLTRHLWPFLRRRGGCVINVSSKATIDPFPGLSAYAAAKAALEGWTRVLAVEGEPHDIRAYAVAPGGVETKMFRDLPDVADVPSEKLLTPADVATTILDCLDGKHPTGDVVRIER